jgi:hypothetical protein
MAMVLLAAGALAGCATQAREGERNVGEAVQQPMRDLSLIRDAVPPSLTEAAVAPYANPAAGDCAALRVRLVELDKALGPDVDTPAESSDAMVGLAGDLVRGAIGLPFRGVVRRVSGAEQRDAALRRAVLAGMVRRGYLKGRLAELSCPPPLPPPAA